MSTAIIEATNTFELLSDQTFGNDYVTIHDAANADSVDDEATTINLGQDYVDLGAPFDPFYTVVRDGLVFDLSAYVGIGISVATLSLMGQADQSTTDFNITIVNGDDLADTGVVADYGDLLDETTSYGALTTSGLALEDWNVITLNSTGLASVQTAVGGTWRCGLRSSRDISATTPKLNGASAYEDITLYGLTTDKKPKLTLTYAGGESRGEIAIKGTRFQYYDAIGTQRYVEGILVA